MIANRTIELKIEGAIEDFFQIEGWCIFDDSGIHFAEMADEIYVKFNVTELSKLIVDEVQSAMFSALARSLQSM